jgi:hypothetical protein
MNSIAATAIERFISFSCFGLRRRIVAPTVQAQITCAARRRKPVLTLQRLPAARAAGMGAA